LAKVLVNPVVLNIPHAQWEFPEPYFSQLIVPEWQWIYETLILNDWFTDELFGFPGMHKVVAPVSRLLVDTERLLPDEDEAMARIGMGCLYTHGTQGQRIRRDPGPEERQEWLDRYYDPHDQGLGEAIQQNLDTDGKCLFVDCHSFPDTPFPFEDQNQHRPDICLGTHADNTPKALVHLMTERFTDFGHRVAVDQPYSGCALPEKYRRDQRVLAIMIEVNRKLYINQPAPPYSQAVVDQSNIPIRNASFRVVKGQLYNTILGAMRAFIKPVAVEDAGDNRPPRGQQQLSRFVHEINTESTLPEMRQWWWDRY